MKLQTLEFFTHIADEKSFSKAASKCFISQPALSQAIKELEVELSCQLFERRGRGIELTNSGKIAYKYSKEMISLYLTMKDDIQNEILRINPLRIGYTTFGHLNYLQEKLDSKSLANVETIIGSAPNVLDELLKNKIDIALLPSPCCENIEGLKTYFCVQNHMFILVHCTHPIYTLDEVRFEDLKNVLVVGWDEENSQQEMIAYQAQFANNGVIPNFVGKAKNLGDMTTLMLKYNAVGLCGPVTKLLMMDSFKVIPVVDSEKRFGLKLVWKEENKHPLLNYIIDNL